LTTIFRVEEPTAAPNIIFAAGQFEVVTHKDQRHADRITHFCLPGREELVSHSTQYLSDIVDHLETYLNHRLPYSYTQVFVDDPYSKINIGASIAIISTHELHSGRVIEQVYKTRRLLALAVARQWFGAFISTRSWSDSWLLYGIAGYLADECLLKSFGSNDVKDRFIRVRLT